MLRELAAKAKKINVQLLALQVVKTNAGLINERIETQLTVGENADGNNVGLYTSARYANFKQRIGSSAPRGIVDLKLSGKLYEGLNTDIKPKTFKTDSSVEYSKYQIKRYGKKIYELQESNSEDIKFKNSVDIYTEYKRLLGL